MKHPVSLLFFFAVAVSAFSQKHAVGVGLYSADSLEWVDVAAVNKSMLLGKVTVLHFWAPWCAPCIKHLPEVQRQAEKYGSAIQTVMVAWSSQSPDTVRRVKERFPMDALWCIDQGNAMFFKHYGAYGIPYAIVHNTKGVAIWEGNGMLLSDQILDSIIATGQSPSEDGEESRTPFKLTVTRALPSDKNGMGAGKEDGRYVFRCRGIPPDAILRETARLLGLDGLISSSEGEWMGVAYNVEMLLDSTILDSAMRHLILHQLALTMSVEVVLGNENVLVNQLSITDAQKFEHAVVNDSTTSDEVTNDVEGLVLKSERVQLGTLVYRLKTQTQSQYELDRELSSRWVRAEFPYGNQLEAHAWFNTHGIGVKPEMRLLPTIITRYPISK